MYQVFLHGYYLWEELMQNEGRSEYQVFLHGYYLWEELMQNEGRNDHVQHYGPWGWIGGFILGALIIYAMFSIADGFM